MEHAQLQGKMTFLADFKKIPAGTTVHQWFVGEPDRIRNKRADAARYMARLNAWWVDNPATPFHIGLPIIQQGKGIPGSDNIDGEEMEAKLVAQELDAYNAAVDEVYRREDQKIAEDLARQQSLLLLFGGLQQINNNLQEQDRYNQQQRYQQEQQFYQQRLLLELSKPIRCQTFGATTTCN